MSGRSQDRQRATSVAATGQLCGRLRAVSRGRCQTPSPVACRPPRTSNNLSTRITDHRTVPWGPSLKPYSLRMGWVWVVVAALAVTVGASVIGSDLERRIRTLGDVPRRIVLVVTAAIIVASAIGATNAISDLTGASADIAMVDLQIVRQGALQGANSVGAVEHGKPYEIAADVSFLSASSVDPATLYARLTTRCLETANAEVKIDNQLADSSVEPLPGMPSVPDFPEPGTAAIVDFAINES